MIDDGTAESSTMLTEGSGDRDGNADGLREGIIVIDGCRDGSELGF